MRIYHGSKKIVSMPICDSGNGHNDFGGGFYATESEELAREWACIRKSGGFLNIYELETDDIAILDLSGKGYGIKNWAALVVSNRGLWLKDQKTAERKNKLIADSIPDTASFDVIKGYRADCSYYSLIISYLEDDISLKELEEAVLTEDLGEQLVIKSEYALQKLTFLDYEAVDGSLYYPKRMMRDTPTEKAESEEALLKPYPKAFVTHAMRLLGEFLEYTSALYPEASQDSIFSMFVISGFAERLENGDPAVIRGLSGPELANKVLSSCGAAPYMDGDMVISGNAAKDLPPRSADYITPALPFWCGRMLAYLQWFKNISFSELLRLLPVSRLRSMHQDLKDMPIEVAAVTIDKRIALRQSSATRLQNHRKRTGLSQKELALASGVNIRTLQQYERRDKDIKKAAAGKLLALSRVMHCSPESLLD